MVIITEERFCVSCDQDGVIAAICSVCSFISSMSSSID